MVIGAVGFGMTGGALGHRLRDSVGVSVIGGMTGEVLGVNEGAGDTVGGASHWQPAVLQSTLLLRTLHNGSEMWLQ